MIQPEFLKKNRLYFDSESKYWLSDKKQPPVILHLLSLASQDTFKISYIDTAEFDVINQADATETKAGGDHIVVRWVQDLIHKAIEQKASDIHFEVREEFLLVRFRLDGYLRRICTFGLEYKEEITSRIKVLADLDIAEKRKPQDGKFQQNIGNRIIDFRVSTTPTGKGEKAVIRLLDRESLDLSISGLGLLPEAEKHFLKAIAQPHGLILATGPTGSGKTTTLYAALNHIRTETLNIMTIEDPIEYQIDGLNQSQVRPNIGFTFSQALRSFLRQDPNVIMVGEIRDKETAKMSIQAALTGHLVFSTLHTNTAPGAVARLVDMGIEPYLIASSLRVTMAQRLVRLLCKSCRQFTTLQPDSLTRLNIMQKNSLPVYSHLGCKTCNMQGYSGRTGVFELFPINSAVRDGIHRQAPEEELIKLQPCYRPMSYHGFTLLRDGRTSLEELMTVVLAD